MELSISSSSKKTETKDMDMLKFKPATHLTIYKHCKNKIQPKHSDPIDFTSFIQERVDFSGFSDFHPNNFNNKIPKKKIKLTYCFCLCISIISMVCIALIVTIFIITNNKSTLKESNNVTVAVSSARTKQTTLFKLSTYLASSTILPIQETLVIRETKSLETTTILKTNLTSRTTKLTSDSTNFSTTNFATGTSKSTSDSKFFSETNLITGTAKFTPNPTTSLSVSRNFFSATVNKENSKNTNIIKNQNFTTALMFQTCQDGYTGTNCFDECGLNYNFDQSTSEIQWSSLVSIHFNYSFNYRLRDSIHTVIYSKKCTGSLISKNTVLTTASCLIEKVFFKFNGEKYVHVVMPNQFYGSFKSMYTIFLVENNFNRSQVFMSSYTKHPNYEENRKLNDIAIIKLTTEVNQNKNHSLLCLPKRSDQIYPRIDISEAYVIGFDSNSTNTLKDDVRITKYNSFECLNVSHIIDWDRQICTIDNVGEKDLCDFEYGSPLLIKENLNGKEKYILVGIISNKSSCDETLLIGTFSRVSYFTDWIYGFL